jgi:hypothetical protein
MQAEKLADLMVVLVVTQEMVLLALSGLFGVVIVRSHQPKLATCKWLI